MEVGRQPINTNLLHHAGKSSSAFSSLVSEVRLCALSWRRVACVKGEEREEEEEVPQCSEITVCAKC